MSTFVMRIDWHEECLKNSTSNCARKKEQALRDLRETEEWEKRNEFYKLQIETAKKQGKTGFNRDRFLVKKEKKND